MAQSFPYGMPSKQRGVGDWFSEAFSLFTQHWMVWVLQCLACLCLVLVATLLVVGVFFIVGLIGGFQLGEGATSAVVAIGIGLLAYLGLLVMGTFLIAGMARTAARQLRGEPIGVADLFSAGDVVAPLVVTTLLMGLASVASLLLLGLPLLLLGPAWMLAFPLVVEGGRGPMEALKESWDAVRSRFWTFFATFVLLNLFCIAAGWIVIGYLVAMPIYMLIIMVAYRDTIGMPGVLGSEAAFTASQFGNYGQAGPPVTVGQCPVCHAPVAGGAVVCAFCHSSLSQSSQS